jgi:hypothetical protein
MRSGFLSTQASIVTYACSTGHFFNKYIVYASMGTNNQVWRPRAVLCASGRLRAPIPRESRPWRSIAMPATSGLLRVRCVVIVSAGY